MRRLLVLCATTLLCSTSAAAAADKQISTPAEKAKLPASYLAKFNHAVDLLDGYRGDPEALEAARDELQNVLGASPQFAPAYRELGRYFIMRGHISSLRFQPGSLEAAESSIKKALEIDPDFAEAYVLFGHLYRLMNRRKEAFAALEKAEKLGTPDPWLQNNWADLLIDEGKYEEAALRYWKVIDSKTPNKKAMVSAFEGLVSYYKGVGQLDRADEIYRKQIEFEPDAAWGYGNYAHFLLCQRDDYEQSIARSRQALQIMSYGVGRFWLAAALYRKWAQNVIAGSPDEGRQYFIEAQAIYPDPYRISAGIRNCSAALNKISMALAIRDHPAKPAPQAPSGGRL